MSSTVPSSFLTPQCAVRAAATTSMERIRALSGLLAPATWPTAGSFRFRQRSVRAHGRRRSRQVDDDAQVRLADDFQWEAARAVLLVSPDTPERRVASIGYRLVVAPSYRGNDLPRRDRISIGLRIPNAAWIGARRPRRCRSTVRSSPASCPNRSCRR